MSDGQPIEPTWRGSEKAWKPSDNPQATDQERERQVVWVKDDFGQSTYVTREEALKRTPEKWRESVARGLDQELLDQRGTKVEDVKARISYLEETLQTDTFTHCLTNNAWTFTMGGTAIGLAAGFKTTKIAPLVILFPLGNALDLTRGYMKCRELLEQDRVLRRLEEQKYFAEKLSKRK